MHFVPIAFAVFGFGLFCFATPQSKTEEVGRILFFSGLISSLLWLSM